MVQVVTNGLYRFCEWVTRLAYLNLLWFVFSCAGLIVFGVMPATAAAFSVTHKWVTGNTDVKLFHTFWGTYKAEFLRANRMGFMLLGIAMLLYLDLRILNVAQGQLSPVQAIFSGLLLLYGLTLLFVFPVYIHYNLPLLPLLMQALLIALSRPLHTAAMAAAAIGIIYTALVQPTFMIFFPVSAFCFVMMWFAVRAFRSIDKLKGVRAGG